MREDVEQEDVRLSSPPVCWVARQPVLTADGRVFAYELLFRDGSHNYYTAGDSNLASSQVISEAFINIGIDTLTGGKPALINFTRQLLVDQTALLFPKEYLGVEILETVEPDEEVLQACRNLKARGYLLLLDDFVLKEKFRSLLGLADIVKIDFQETCSSHRRHLVRELTRLGLQLLAEKVETPQQFQEGVRAGFHYFQGYFFKKPVLLSRRRIPSFRLAYLQLLQLINAGEPDFNELESLIRQDLGLSYRLLRYINSAAFAWSEEVTSVRRALTLLGEKNLRRFASLLVLSMMVQDKPSEILTTALIRAYYCERLALLLGLERESLDLYFMGMFSLMDVILDQPLEKIVDSLPLSPEVKATLRGEPGPYSPILASALAYEAADWERLLRLAGELGLEESRLATCYWEAVGWSQQLLEPASPKRA